MENPLTCWRVRRSLQTLLDGELTPSTAKSLRRHLERCTRCRIEERTLRRVIDLLHQLRTDHDATEPIRLAALVEWLQTDLLSATDAEGQPRQGPPQEET